MSRVLVLLATIPERRSSCNRVLSELAKQTRPPDGVVFVLDGYGDKPAPETSLPIAFEKRTAELSGAGARWRVLSELPTDDIIINIDDDMVLFEAPNLIQKLAESVEQHGGAAAPIGRTFDGKAAPPGAYSRGTLMYAAGHGVAARVGVLAGVLAFAAEVKAAGGPDALAPQGDDDAIVSAYLWKAGVTVRHVATGNMYTAGGIKSTFKPQKDACIQKRAIAKVTGWPWKMFQLLGGART